MFRFGPVRDRIWVLGQMALARLDLARDAECRFAKLCGSGSGEGFTPRPNTAVWAILAVWPDAATARERTADGAVHRRWRDRATEDWTLFLSPVSSRGHWSGQTPFAATEPADAPDGPVASLTRATIRPAHLRAFWRHEPAISARIGDDPSVLFKIGLGDVPLRNQLTFSVWPDIATLTGFARTGPHADAIRAVRAGNWFAEELYARFRVVGTTGAWADAPDLTQPEAA